MNNDFLGKGWAFPPAFDRSSGGVKMAEGLDDINQCLHILLSTKLGERIMRPDFGCNMDEAVFEAMSTSFQTYIKDLVKQAILLYEPRITLISITTANSDELNGVMLIEVTYQVKGHNTRSNYVYPYYIQEGTNINL